MSRTLILALALAGAVPASAGRPLPSLDLKEYLAELDRWSVAARRLEAHPGEATALRKELPESWTISIGRQRFSVSTDWLGAALGRLELEPARAGESSREIGARLAAFRSEAEALAEPSRIRPAEVRTKLDKILMRREFESAHAPVWIDRLGQRLHVWLMELVERLVDRFQGHPLGLRVVLWALVIGSGLMLLVSLVRLVLGRSATPLHLELEGATPAPTSWRDFALQAQAEAGRGSYRESLRLAYWAAVYRLEEVGIWHVERDRTHREYLRLLPASHPNRGAVSAITWRFEQVWYGGRAASSDDFKFALAQLEQLGCAFPSTPVTAKS